MATTEKLEHRTLGKGGPSVAAIGLGCMSLSGAYGKSDDAEAIRVDPSRDRSRRQFPRQLRHVRLGPQREPDRQGAAGAGAPRSCWRPSSARRRSRAAPTASMAARPM